MWTLGLFSFLFASLATAGEPVVLPPQVLLDELYAESRVIAIGEANHTRSTGMNTLIAFLRKHGEDPQLKYVFLEGSHQFAAEYEKLSLPGAMDRSDDFFTKGPEGYCRFRGRSYRMAHLLPLIREINRRRPVNNPLIATSFDGVSEEPFKPEKRRFVKGACKYRPLEYTSVHSGDRERSTASRFLPLWDRMVRDDHKGVMLYHQFHLARDIQSCMSARIGEREYTTQYERETWLGHFLDQRAGAREQFRSVAIDEQDFIYARRGIYSFVPNLQTRIQQQAWATHSLGLSPEVTSSELLQSGHYRKKSARYWQAGLRFEDLFDGLMHFESSAGEYYSSPAAYRPECAGVPLYY